MDFEQLRKDMEDGTDGPWADTGSVYGAEVTDGTRKLVRAQGIALAGTPQSRVNARRIARVPDLERIALAAEKYRKADEAFGTTKTPADSYRVSREITEARAELFALLTSKDAT